jgi:hypothetical protein
MTLFMLIVAAALSAVAVVVGWILDTRGGRPTRVAAVEPGWGQLRDVNRGRLAARRRRQEAEFVARLTRKGISRTDYRSAMSTLAAQDAARYAIDIPRLRRS